jgi:hypothetical protein
MPRPRSGAGPRHLRQVSVPLLEDALVSVSGFCGHSQALLRGGVSEFVVNDSRPTLRRTE